MHFAKGPAEKFYLDLVTGVYCIVIRSWSQYLKLGGGMWNRRVLWENAQPLAVSLDKVNSVPNTITVCVEENEAARSASGIFRFVSGLRFSQIQGNTSSLVVLTSKTRRGPTISQFWALRCSEMKMSLHLNAVDESWRKDVYSLIHLQILKPSNLKLATRSCGTLIKSPTYSWVELRCFKVASSSSMGLRRQGIRAMSCYLWVSLVIFSVLNDTSTGYVHQHSESYLGFKLHNHGFRGWFFYQMWLNPPSSCTLSADWNRGSWINLHLRQSFHYECRADTVVLHPRKCQEPRRYLPTSIVTSAVFADVPWYRKFRVRAVRY